MKNEDKIIDIISEHCGIVPVEITKEATFHELGFDSLDKVELVMEIEIVFHITIPDEVEEKLETVNDLIKYVESQCPDRN